MITQAAKVFAEAAIKAGIPEQNITNMPTDGITLPKPRMEIRFNAEEAERSGYRLAEIKSKNGIRKVFSMYKVCLNAVCEIYADTTDEIEMLSSVFLCALPHKFPDAGNNIVLLNFISGEWKTVSGTQVRLTVIDPLKVRSRLMRFNFIYHIAAENETAYMQEFNITNEVKNG